MGKQEVVEAAKALVGEKRPFVLATVDEGGVPQVRWMGALYVEEPLTMYMAAGADSRKMRQIKAHAKGQLMFQSEDYGKVATLTGEYEVVTDAETKRRVWEGIPGAHEYFEGPDHPGFGVIRFVCRRVEVLGLKEGMETATAEV